MARISDDQLLKLSGKLQGLVFCRRGRSRYVRIWVKPKNPKTVKQQARRKRFAEAVRAWRRLAAEQRSKYTLDAHKQGRTGYHLFLSTFLSKES